MEVVGLRRVMGLPFHTIPVEIQFKSRFFKTILWGVLNTTVTKT